jgi:phosphatidylserine/phosphatidylglycerophosphate/cardiolipin synthase-like enzyme
MFSSFPFSLSELNHSARDTFFRGKVISQGSGFAITAATRSIELCSAYFVPDTITRRALVRAVERGVRVRILLPGKHTDEATVRRASRGLWGLLLEAGVQIHEYQPTMFHCKLMIVDGLMTSVGSTNFDMRSFRLNDEANLNIYDTAFAGWVFRRIVTGHSGDRDRCP